MLYIVFLLAAPAVYCFPAGNLCWLLFVCCILAGKVWSAQRLHAVGSPERRTVPPYPFEDAGCPAAGPRHRRYCTTYRVMHTTSNCDCCGCGCVGSIGIDRGEVARKAVGLIQNGAASVRCMTDQACTNVSAGSFHRRSRANT